MTKVEIKKPIVDEIKGYLEKAVGIILIDYRSLTVEEDLDFNGKMRQACIKYGVYKNTYLGFAFEGTDYTALEPHLEGPTSVAFLHDDYTEVEDIICEFVEHTPLTVKGAFIEGVYYDEKSFYSKVKERKQKEYFNEHIHEMVIAGMRLPITRLEYVLKQVIKQKQREEREREFDEWNNDYIRVHGEKAFNEMLSCLSWEEYGDEVDITGIKFPKEEIWIPAKINGKLVRRIKGNILPKVQYDSVVKQIQIPNSVTDICNNAFWGQQKLEKVKIPKSVKYIGERAFSSSNLTEIIVEEGNPVFTSKDFYGNECNAIFDIERKVLILGCGHAVIPEGITHIREGAFYGCQSLIKIVLPSSLNIIGMNAFGGCDNLAEIVFSKGSKYISMSCAFLGCDKPKKIIFSESVEYIDWSFIRCIRDINKIEQIVVDPKNKKYTSRDENGEECNAVIDIDHKELVFGCGQTVIPEGVLFMDSYAFSGCKELTEIVFPESLKSIDNYSFSGCDNLKKVTFPKSLVEIGDEAFAGCHLSEVIDLSPYPIHLTGVFDEDTKIIHTTAESSVVNEEESEEVPEEVALQNDKEEEISDGCGPLSADSDLSSEQDNTHDNKKPIRVLVFAKGDKVNEAEAAGADYVGAEDLIPKIQNDGWFEFDVVVATPDMMGVVGRLGRVLGPKGLMPSPWAGTITMDVAKVVKELKEGKMEIPSEKTISERMKLIRARVDSLTSNETTSNKEHKDEPYDWQKKNQEMSYGVRRDATKSSKKKVRWIPLVIILFVLAFFALGLFGVI